MSKRIQNPLFTYLIPFLDHCEIEKGLSSNTQRNYRQYLALFLKWLSRSGKKDILPNQLAQDDVWNYRLYLARKYKTRQKKTLSKRSQNYYLIALRALLDFFTEKDITCIPSSKIKLAKEQNEKQISFLELYEVEKILMVPNTSSFSGLRDRAILELLFSTGMRISELVNLDKDNIAPLLQNRGHKTIEISIIGKGGKTRSIYISPRAFDWIKKYLNLRKDSFAKPLFINIRSKNPDKKRLSSRSIQLMVSKFAKRAGISKRVTPHTLRHTYATDLLSHGADLRSVQEFLGHKSVATTQVYTHLTNKQLRDIHERFHGGKDLPITE